MRKACWCWCLRICGVYVCVCVDMCRSILIFVWVTGPPSKSNEQRSRQLTSAPYFSLPHNSHTRDKKGRQTPIQLAPPPLPPSPTTTCTLDGGAVYPRQYLCVRLCVSLIFAPAHTHTHIRISYDEEFGSSSFHTHTYLYLLSNSTHFLHTYTHT
jgi:hypothetical protein